MSKKIAVILSGCGYLDGAEIRESVLSLLALSNEEAEVKMFAPNRNQFHQINHFDQNEIKEEKNILIESARIARGEIESLDKCLPSEFDGLFIPGGYGVAKNFCDFALKGSNASVHEDIKSLCETFYHLKKPIAALCIAPALLALIFKSQNIEITIGNDQETVQEIEKLGAVHRNTTPDEICTDTKNKMITTGAYMFESAPLREINKGINKCVRKLIELA